MISNDRLILLDSFRVDRKLPKFQETKKAKKPAIDPNIVAAMKLQKSDFVTEEWGDSEQAASVVNSFMTSNSSALTFSTNAIQGGVLIGQKMQSEPRSFWDKLKILRGRKKAPPEPKPLITVQDFFKSIKNSVAELAVIRERAAGYEATIQQALEMGQTALVEQLKDNLMVARQEAQMVANGFTKYVDEKTIVEFSKKAPRGLDLIWVENFTRIIPPNVRSTKLAADQRGLFDNYCILAYDPKGVAKKDTKAEVERKKDPILFGLIKDSRKLYFVGDWVDELCDLTLDAIADKMGAESIKKV